MAISLLNTKEYKQSQMALSAIIEDEQSGIVKIYATALKESQAKLKKLYDKFSKDGILSNSENTLVAQLRAIEDECAQIIKKASLNVEKTINEQTQNIYNQSFYRHVWSIDQNINASINWGLIPEDGVSSAFNSSYKFLAKSKTFKMAQNKDISKVRDAISLALVRGDSYQTLSKRLTAALGVTDIASGAKRYIGKGAAAWAMTVSRTEGQRAIVEGQNIAYQKAKDAGCDISLFWDATLDNRTRSSHGALDGTAKDDEHGGWYVPELGIYVPSPLHSGVAGFDVNCRCRLTPRLNYLGEDAKPTERRIKGEGVKKYKTYNEWVAENTKASPTSPRI